MLEMERDEYVQRYRGARGCFYWGVWLLWMLANAVALFIGEYLGEAVEALIVQPDSTMRRLLTIEGRIELASPTGYLAAAVGGIVAGIVLGIAQGLVLLPFLKRRGMVEWIIVTAIGRAARWVVVFVLSQQLIRLVADRHIFGLCLVWLLLAGLGCIAGIALGYPQSVILQRRSNHSWWWLLANLPGPIFASILIGFALYINGENSFRGVAGVIVVMVTAATTGIVLMDMLRHPKPEAEWAEGLKHTWRPERSKEPVEDTILGSTLYGPKTSGAPDNDK